jgi:LPPG:FO 2-phospho-L-lactate transferase
LSAVTQEVAAALGVRAKVVPVSDGRLRTIVRTAHGELDFQTYFVRRRSRDRVLGLRFNMTRKTQAAPGVIEAIRRAQAVIVCPSNPFISIGPILAVPGVRDALRRTRAPVAAISPIVGGKALKGPAARMMKSLGLRASAAAVAEIYRDFVNVFMLDRVDAREAAEVKELGLRPVVTNTVMSGPAQKRALARAVVRALEIA